MKLEICTQSYQSALNARDAGADRVEMCAELALGGITPSYGLAKQVLENLDIPTFVLIRPRSGDFVYSDAEFDSMKKDLIAMRELGCEGIVSGVLHSDFSIDYARTAELLHLAEGLPFTFHRAFDWVANPEEAIGKLLDLGVSRVLTSGQGKSAAERIDFLVHLQEIAGDNLIILPGGGIREENAALFRGKFKEIHCSALSEGREYALGEIDLRSQKIFESSNQMNSGKKKIQEILRQLKGEN